MPETITSNDAHYALDLVKAMSDLGKSMQGAIGESGSEEPQGRARPRMSV